MRAVLVYFENKEKTKVDNVAIFKDEYTYNDNIQKLERLSSDMGFGLVTESDEQRSDIDQLFELSNMLSDCEGTGGEQMLNLAYKLWNKYRKHL